MKKKLTDTQRFLVEEIQKSSCCGSTVETKEKKTTSASSCCGSNQPVREQPKSNGGCCG